MRTLVSQTVFAFDISSEKNTLIVSDYQKIGWFKAYIFGPLKIMANSNTEICFVTYKAGSDLLSYVSFRQSQ